MTKEEYKNKMAEIEKTYETETKKTQREFAFSNKKHDKGDILKENGVSIVVDEIKWGFNGFFNEGLPCCVYIGRVLKKDGTFRKDGQTLKIYEQ